MAWPEFIFILAMPAAGDLSKSEDRLFVSLMQKKHWVEAVKFYEAILQRIPDYPPALNALAMVAYKNQDFETAFRVLGSLLKKFPENPIWLNNFALVSVSRQELVVARGALQQALRIAQKQSELLYNSGCLSVCEGELLLALQIHQQVLVGEPNHIRALFALSRIAKELGLVDEAIACCRKLVELVPDNAGFRQNLGLMLLKNGELKEGLELYEARWQANKLPMLSPDLLWQGQDLSGKTILVWAEQGLGDSINFARYLLDLQEMAEIVVVAVPGVLQDLFSVSFPGVNVVGLDERSEVEYNFQIPFLSLPHILQTRIDSVPANIPYLQVDKTVYEKWRARIGETSFLKVGIVWAGNPKHANDAKRSIPLEIFRRFWVDDGVKYYGLQKEVMAGDAELLATLVCGSKNLIDFSDELNDFQDTAAILQNIDLMISVDTSVAHLAGALACPTWLLLHFDADWRWLLEREDSPWYPTMRLFRQPQPGDWESVIAEVCECLRKTVGVKSG